MQLTLGFSPCPNDTFIFEALINQRIDTEGLDFNVSLSDVEQLNKWSFKGKLDITKLSFNAYSHCLSEYVLLDSGSALGRKCGPLLISNPSTLLTSASTIGIPGKYTTANLLLGISKPGYTNKIEVLFSDIENQVLLGKVDAGLIIHENRFTYHHKGLIKILDLGEFWENETGLPLPLGGIVVRRSLPFEIRKRVERVLRRSIRYAMDNRGVSLEFVRNHAQEMELEIINSHIDLYVNNYSISLGHEGKDAVKLLLLKAGIVDKDIFL